MGVGIVGDVQGRRWIAAHSGGDVDCGRGIWKRDGGVVG